MTSPVRGCASLASQPFAAALQAADDDAGVLDGRPQRAQRRGVVHGVAQGRVDLRCLLADRAGQEQDRHDERDDGEYDDDAYNPAEGPAEVTRAARRRGQVDCCAHMSLHRGSHRLAEVADGLEVGVDRGQPFRNGAGEVRHGPDAAGRRDQGCAHGPEVEDDPQQSDRGQRDYQSGDDERHPCSCWHSRSPFWSQPRSLATEPAYLTAPTDTARMVSSVVARASGTSVSSPTSATPPARMSSVACRMRSTAASTLFSRKITTG